MSLESKINNIIFERYELLIINSNNSMNIFNAFIDAMKYNNL